MSFLVILCHHVIMSFHVSYYVILCVISCHFVCHNMSFHVSYHVILCVVSCHFMCHILPLSVLSSHVISCHIMPHHVPIIGLFRQAFNKVVGGRGGSLSVQRQKEKNGQEWEKENQFAICVYRFATRYFFATFSSNIAKHRCHLLERRLQHQAAAPFWAVSASLCTGVALWTRCRRHRLRNGPQLFQFQFGQLYLIQTDARAIAQVAFSCISKLASRHQIIVEKIEVRRIIRKMHSHFPFTNISRSQSLAIQKSREISSLISPIAKQMQWIRWVITLKMRSVSLWLSLSVRSLIYIGLGVVFD
jgi:hypothetical protein